MTVNDSRLMKGTLKFGPDLTGQAVEGQITNCVIEQQDGDKEDVVYVLSGESVGGDTTAGAWHITGTMIQDHSATPSFQKWSYLNKDTDQEFSFTPNDSPDAPVITGTASVKFLGLGGDVRDRSTRDFDWGIVGSPDFGIWEPVDPDEGVQASAPESVDA